MADAAVDHLIGIIMSALEKEASLLGGIHDELNSLRIELDSMKSFLVEAERNQLKSESEKTWVNNVRDMAYEVEDIIDEFLYYMHRCRQGNRSTRFFRRIIKAPKYLQVKHQIATKLLNINKNIKEIPERKQRYKIDPVEGSSSDHNSSLYLRDSSIFMKKDDLVGFENESRLLNSWLEEEEQQRTLISVVGIGGSGKTSLVAEVCRNETMKSHFDCQAWITVSQTYKRDEILRSMIKEFYEPRKEEMPPDLGMKGYKELGDLLISYLEHKRYLLVLDDVWDTNLWTSIMVALPNNHLRSRIVLTTRRQDVGSFSSGVKCYTLHVSPLKSNEAWDLFSKKAFTSYPNKSCPHGLEKLVWELVERCKGLPLAIDALGALMSSKSTAEWSIIRNNLKWQLSNNQNLEVVKTILLLSYNELPYPLKHCFLYCCLFPEDYEIKRKKLIRLWIAEGFVIQGNSQTPEEVAESYLRELIFRSMLQVVERNYFGRPKKCKMHDILHDIAQSISEREKFCSVYDGNSNFTSEKSKSRRLSIQKTYGLPDSYSSMLQVRSLLVFVTNSGSFPNTLLSKFKLLRVLDLEGSMIDKLADGLGTLFNLRYLNLKGTQVAELPRSIGKLFNLETLNIANTRIRELPKEVAGLQNLRYLIMYTITSNLFNDFHYVRGTRAPFKINKLKNLQAMSVVEAEGDIITQLGTMRQLIRVEIANLKEANEMELCSSIMNLHQLYYLGLKARDENEFLRLDAFESPPPHLRTLWLFGRLERVPHWFLSLQHLVTLGLLWSRLQEDPLPHIASLPHLATLLLWNSFGGKELHFSSGFAKLTTLQLVNLPELTVVSIEKGVMPDIQVLLFRHCKKLTSLPQGIEFLTNLQSLYLLGNSPELGNDLSKVQHVPNKYVG